MKLTKEITNYFHLLFDEILPPWIRDSKWFMFVPFKILFGEKSSLFFEYKENAGNYKDKQIAEIYKKTLSAHITRESDLNTLSLHKILNSTLGLLVLDVGCGRGFLANRLSEKYKVIAVDFVINSSTKINSPQVQFAKASCISLPFKNQIFDTVICSHTLEHVQDFNSTVRELRRVTKKRLIIVVPKQRAYKYTFDLHLHFFPYVFSLVNALGNHKQKTYCEELNRDLVYIEDYQ